MRHEYLAHIGLDADSVARSGGALALSELHIRFRAPLRSGDAFVGTMRVTRAAGVRVHIEQQLMRERSDAAPEVCAWDAAARMHGA